MSYGTRFIVPCRSLDGFYYRALIKLRGYTGTLVEVLTGTTSCIVVEHGRPGTPDLTHPLPGSSITVTVLDDDSDIFAPIAASDDAAWMVVLERGEDALFTGAVQLGQWYVLPERFRDQPFKSHGTSTIQATDGFGLLQSVPFEPLFTEELFQVIRDSLDVLGWQGGLSTLMRWRPYVSSPPPATDDPLTLIHSLDDAWAEAEGRYATLLGVLRETAGRFLSRFFQSGGRWYLWQRHALRGGAPTVWEYDTAGALAGQSALDIIVEDEEIAKRSGVVREVLPRVRQVLSEYEYGAEIESLIAGGSFEDDTDWWDMVGNVSYWDIPETSGSRHAITVTLSSILGASAGDARVLRAYGNTSGVSSVAAATQDIGVPIVAGPGQEVVFEFNSRTVQGGGETATPAGVLVSIYQSAVEELWLSGIPATAVSDSLSGEKATVYIEPLGGGFAEYVEGTEILPAGAVINFVAAGGDPLYDSGSELTLTRPVKIGDSSLAGRLSGPVSAGWVASVYIWHNPAWTLPSFLVGTPAYGGTDFRRAKVHASLTAPDGTLISGALKTEITMPSVTGGGPPLSTVSYSDIDDMTLKHRMGGLPVRSMSWQAVVLSPAHGDQVEAGPFLLGDGPTPEAPGRLLFTDGGLVLQSTLQGLNTGWKDGAYAVAEASTGESLDMLYARTLLLAQADGLERLLCDLLLRGGQTFFPHQILRHYQFARLAYAGPSTAEPDRIVTRTRIPVGAVVTLGGASFSAIESLPGMADFTTVLDGTPAQQVAGTPVYFTKDFAPDHLRWDVAPAEMRFEGTELAESASDYTISQVIQEA